VEQASAHRSIYSGFIGLGAVFGTLCYLVEGGPTLEDTLALWLVTASGFAAGFLRDRTKQST
jgi:hypothetical protein